MILYSYTDASEFRCTRPVRPEFIPQSTRSLSLVLKRIARTSLTSDSEDTSESESSFGEDASSKANALTRFT